MVDGKSQLLQGYTSTSAIKQQIDGRKGIIAPVTITIASSCPQSSGNSTVTIKNTSISSISGTLQFVVKERGIKYSWQDLNYVENAARSMIPDEKGEAVTIAAGQSISKTRSFTIGSGWVKDSCRLVAFLQKSDKEIVEACITNVNNNQIATKIETYSNNSNSFKIQVARKSIMAYVPNTDEYIISIEIFREEKLLIFLTNLFTV